MGDSITDDATNGSGNTNSSHGITLNVYDHANVNMKNVNLKDGNFTVKEQGNLIILDSGVPNLGF